MRWSVDKGEDLARRAVRKVPGHSHVENFVARVRRRRSQQWQHQHQQAGFDQRRGESRGSRRGHRAGGGGGGGAGGGVGYDDRPRGGRVSAGSGRVIGSVREEESFGKFEIQPEPEPEAAAGPRGQAMFPSVFDGPEAAAPRSPGTILKATQDSLDADFEAFFGEPSKPQPKTQPGVGSGSGGQLGGLQSQLDWMDSAGQPAPAPAPVRRSDLIITPPPHPESTCCGLRCRLLLSRQRSGSGSGRGQGRGRAPRPRRRPQSP